MKKTKAMILQNNPPKLNKNFNLIYKGHILENVREYKYLGCVITNNGNLTSCSIDLANKARKVLFAINSYTSDFGNIPVNVACNLFNTLVRPILTYNSEVCFMDSYLKFYNAQLRGQKSNSTVEVLSFVDKTPMEKIHLNFIKHTLGIKRCATNVAARAELDRLPIEAFIKIQTISYLSRLNNDKLNPLLKEAFSLSKLLDDEGQYSWYTYAKNVSKESETDIEYISNCKTFKQSKRIKPNIKNNVSNYYSELIQNKIKNLTNENKIFLYKFL